MNFRSTVFAFGILLGMFWLFGLMLALHTGTLEADLVLPSLHGARDVEIDEVTLERQETDVEPKTLVFYQKDDRWRMRAPPVKRSAAVNASTIESMINNVRDARQNREASLRNDPAFYGLDKPLLTVTLRGQEKGTNKDREWRLFIGKRSTDDKGFVYVNSSDRKGQVLAVPQSTLASVFVGDGSELRLKPLLDTAENSVQWISLTAGKKTTELKKGEGLTWQFIAPKLGYAEWQSPDAKKLGPVEVAPDGVRAVAGAVAALRVEGNDDFVPLSDDDLSQYGLSPGNEQLRIEVSNSVEDRGKSTQVLFVGKRAPAKDRYYARLANEESIVKVDGSKLAPLFAAVKDPEALRSRQLIHIEPKNITRLEIRADKEAIDLQQPSNDNWKIEFAGETRQAASSAVKDLLQPLQEERQIQEFIDVTGDEAKKKDTELGLDQPSAVIKLWSKPPDEEKTTEKKDSKEKKADSKPGVVVEFGAATGELVYGKSVTADGITTRFAVAKTLLEKLLPNKGALALLDTGMPVFDADKVAAITRVVNGVRAAIVKDNSRWQFVNGKDSAAKKLADSKRVEELLSTVNHLKASEWVQKVDAKTDLAEFGLKSPLLEVAVRVRDHEMTANDYAGVAGLAAAFLTRPLLSAISISAQRAAAGERDISYRFGRAKDKDGAEKMYGRRNGSDLVFQIADADIETIRTADLRDRFWLTRFDPVLDASLIGSIAAGGPNAALAGSPLSTHQVSAFDPTQVKEVRVAIRTPAELRRFSFIRKDDKIWQDKTGLEEFEVDSPQLNQLVEKLRHLTAASFVSLQGEPALEQKLSPKEATVHVELLRSDGKPAISLTVGTKAEATGYYAQSSTWPGVIFVLPATEIEALQRGAAYFGKTKVALGN